MPLTAALFDFDGTLFQTEQVHFLSMRTVMEPFLGETLSLEELESMAGFQYHERVTRMVALRGLDVPKEEQRQLVRQARDVMRSNEHPSTMLVPGAVEFVQELADAGIKLALVTSTFHHRADPFLTDVGLSEHLSVRVCSEDVSRRKPDPEPYTLAATLLGVEPAGCAVFEDSPAGITSARDAGAGVIVGIGSDADRLAGTHHTMASFTDFSVTALQGLFI